MQNIDKSPSMAINPQQIEYSANSHEVTIGDLLLVAFGHWRIVLLVTIAGVLVGLGLTFVLRPVYRASVLLSVSENSSLNGGHGDVMSQFSGLASLAGVSMGGDQNKAEALAELSSRDITDRFIAQENLAPVMFANRWDAKSGKWLNTGRRPPPTEGQAFRLFDKRVRKVGADKKTGLVTLNVEWSDRTLAANWANRLVRMANDTLREKAIAEASQNLAYLNNALAHTNEVELRKTLSDLIESQQKTLMLANERPDYIFKVIDPAKAPDPDDYVSPRKMVFVPVGAFVALVIGVIGVNIWVFSRRSAIAPRGI